MRKMMDEGRMDGRRMEEGMMNEENDGWKEE